MINIDIPGFGSLKLHHLVLDYNGTIAMDGKPLDRTIEILNALSSHLKVHIVTADTFGSTCHALRKCTYHIQILSKEDQHLQKKEYVERLGADRVISIGNGRNDRDMLRVSALGIAVRNEEGTAVEALMNADIFTGAIQEALALVIQPKRLIATLRS
jgi:P-type E1-E2 ATPase